MSKSATARNRFRAFLAANRSARAAPRPSKSDARRAAWFQANREGGAGAEPLLLRRGGG